MDPGFSFALLSIGVALLNSTKYWLRFVGTVCLLASMFAYNSERAFIPIFFLVLALVYKNYIVKYLSKNKLASFSFIIGSLFLLYTTFFGSAGSRMRSTSFLFLPQDNFSNQGNLNLESRAIGGVTLAVRRIGKFAQNYLSYFHPKFLFFPNGHSHDLLGFTEKENILLILFPFFLIGAFTCILNKNDLHKRNLSKIFILWLLIAPIPAALTNDLLHPGRSLIMLPPIIFLCTVGINRIISITSNKPRQQVIAAMTVVILSLNFFSYYLSYYRTYPEKSELSFQGYFQSIAKWLKPRSENYSKVVVSHNNPITFSNELIFLAWYMKIDPSMVQKDRTFSDINYLDKFNNITSSKPLGMEPICALLNDDTLVILSKGESNELNTMPVKEFFSYERYEKPEVLLRAYETNNVLQSDKALIKNMYCALSI